MGRLGLAGLLVGTALTAAACTADISEKLPEFESLSTEVQTYIRAATKEDKPSLYQKAIDLVDDPESKKQIAEYAVDELLSDAGTHPSSAYSIGFLQWAIKFEPDKDKKEGLIDSGWEQVENYYKANNGDYSLQLAANFAGFCSEMTSNPEKRKRLMNDAVGIYTTLGERASKDDPGKAAEYFGQARVLGEYITTAE